MGASKAGRFWGRYQAFSITVIYLLVSGIWVYVSNYLLFADSSVQTLGHWEELSDAGVVLATAVLLYVLVRRSIVRLQRSERALKDQSTRLQMLSHKLMEVQESERRAIARELHDEIGQVLTGLKLSLEMFDRLAEDARHASLRESLRLVDDMISRVRKLSMDLRPAALDDLGLLPALLLHFERYSSQTGIQVDFKQQGLDGSRFDPALETAACRIVQEALTNVARHARTEIVEVRIWVDGEVLQLEVEDSGAGFDTRGPRGIDSSGLAGIRERVSILGGVFTIDSRPGAGTRVAAELPLVPAARIPSIRPIEISA